MARRDTSPDALGLPPGGAGVLASQHLRRAIDAGVIGAAAAAIPDASVQPASLDLHLGDVAYRIRCSFLPDASDVDAKRKDLTIDELDLREGAVLETKRPYLIPLAETLTLPPWLRGKANPKSSTGRLDVFTRVITDASYRFDTIDAGYRGGLFLEVVPLSFTVRVRQGLALNQLRLLTADAHPLTDTEIRELHSEEPLLAHRNVPVAPDKLATGDGLFLGLDLRGGRDHRVGYRSKDHTTVIDMGLVGHYDASRYWEPVIAEPEDRVVLDPERFYLLLSDDAVRIPPAYAAEMTAYDPTSGELRTHYAGFFDPGFGHDPRGEFIGSRAALEVRAHDVPFMIEHRQRVCKLTFEPMVEEPEVLYGSGIGSSYQQQTDTLSKHFTRHATTRPTASDPAALFSDDAEDDAIQREL
jgi:dCTP deaminase